MRAKWFLVGLATASIAFFFISAVPGDQYSNGADGRFQIAGTARLVYILDTRTGEVRFCGIDEQVVSFNPFSDSQNVKYLEKGYCAESKESDGSYREY